MRAPQQTKLSPCPVKGQARFFPAAETHQKNQIAKSSSAVADIGKPLRRHARKPYLKMAGLRFVALQLHCAAKLPEALRQMCGRRQPALQFFLVALLRGWFYRLTI